MCRPARGARALRAVLRPLPATRRLPRGWSRTWSFDLLSQTSSTLRGFHASALSRSTCVRTSLMRDQGRHRIRRSPQADTLEVMAAINAFSELRPPLDTDAALLEADRCLFCAGPYAPPPCAAACPAGVDVPRFVREIAEGRPLTAATTIFRDNLLGATCARVCPVEVLCEGACVLLHEGRKPIEIARLQRYATDTALAAHQPLRPRASSNGCKIRSSAQGPPGLPARESSLRAASPSMSTTPTTRPAERCARRSLLIAKSSTRCPQSAKRSRSWASNSTSAFVSALETSWPHSSTPRMRCSSGSGSDRIGRSTARGRSFRLLAVAGVHRGAEARHPPEVGGRVVVLGGGNTAIDVARESRSPRRTSTSRSPIGAHAS